MTEYPFAIVDTERVRVFSALSGTKKLFQTAQTCRDEQGIPWRFVPCADSVLGISTLGTGWVWEEAGRNRSPTRFAKELQRVRDATGVELDEQFQAVIDRLRLGKLAERLLWTIHQHLLRTGSSRLDLAEPWLAAQVWGTHAPPRTWRQDMVAICEGLWWLHVADRPVVGENPRFGDTTSLFGWCGTLLSSYGERCPEACPMQHGNYHRHFQVNVGRGFLGVLETCGTPDNEGIRNYRFPIGSREERGSAQPETARKRPAASCPRTSRRSSANRRYVIPYPTGSTHCCRPWSESSPGIPVRTGRPIPPSTP